MIMSRRKILVSLVAVAAIVLSTHPLFAGSSKSAKQRPVTDFVDAQGGFPPDVLFVPPVENFVGFSDPNSGLFASVDYAGLADEAIMELTDGAVSFNTTFDGKVTERPLKDGRTEVHVILKTSNALTWVFDTANFDDTDPDPFNNVPLEFGARIGEILEGAEPALGDSQLQVTFIHGEPVGGDLPDLLQLLFAPTEDQEVLSLSFHSNTIGELADGSTGRATVQQRAIFGGDPADDFKVEQVRLKAIGKP